MSEHAKLIECLLTRPVQARGENRSSIPVCGSDRLLFQDPRKDWKLLIALRKSYRPLRAPPQAHAHQPPIKREAATQCSPIRWRSIQRRRRRAGPRPTSSSSASGSSRRSRRLTQWTIPDSDSSKLELPVLATPPSVRYSGYRSIIEPRLVVAPILRGCLERVLAVAPHAAEPLPEELRDMPPAANASWGRVWDDSVSLQESLFSPKGVRESPKYYPSHRSWSPTVPHEDRGRSGSSSSSPVLHDVSTQDETLPESVSERINESVFHPQTSPALECPADIADSDRPAGSDDPASQCQPDASKHYLKAEPGECSAPIIEVGPNEPLSCKPRGCSSSIIDVGPDWNPGDPPLLEPNGCSSPIIDVGTDWNQNDPLPSEPSGCSNRILDVGPEWTPDGPSHFVQSPSPSSVVSIWDDEGEPMDDAPPRNWRTPDEDCPTGDWTGPIREIEIGNCPQEPSDESKNEPTRISRGPHSIPSSPRRPSPDPVLVEPPPPVPFFPEAIHGMTPPASCRLYPPLPLGPRKSPTVERNLPDSPEQLPAPPTPTLNLSPVQRFGGCMMEPTLESPSQLQEVIQAAQNVHSTPKQTCLVRRKTSKIRQIAPRRSWVPRESLPTFRATSGSNLYPTEAHAPSPPAPQRELNPNSTRPLAKPRLTRAPPSPLSPYSRAILKSRPEMSSVSVWNGALKVFRYESDP